MRKKIKIAIFSIAIISAFFLAGDIHAIEPIISKSNDNGNYQLRDIINLAVKVAQLIWGVSGSVALAFFVYGGFTWITSAGSSERINKGRQIFQNAVIGLVLIFGSWLIINFAFYALRGGNNVEWYNTAGTWFGNSQSN
jgi:hypothetical protein